MHPSLTLWCLHFLNCDQVVKLLIEKGLNVNEKTCTGETALTRCLASVTKETSTMDASILK